MLHRSRRAYSLMPLQSSVNASWRKPPGPSLVPYELFTSSTKPSICVDRLLLHLRRDRGQVLDESLNKRETSPTPRTKKTLVDEIKMDRLLQQLRTNEFVGTIAPKHCYHYLSEGLLKESAKKCTVHELMTRRSFASVSTKRELSHFKAARRKAKSTSAVAA
jgi:hypothetical protein